MDHTTEFSFILKPSKHGVGVFAAHDIAKGTPLRLYAGEDIRDLELESVPPPFRDYCVARPGGRLWCPPDFGRMAVGWYLNHSTKPNAAHRNYEFFALHDIRKDEEVTIDYNSLEEPEEAKASYYGQ